MRVIVCGSRDWNDSNRLIYGFLFNLRQTHGGEHTIIHGGARGADQIAGWNAEKLGFHVEQFPADWKGKGRGAGPIRNREMLNSGADLVVAFKHDFDGTLLRGGTENMVRIAAEAGVRTIVLPVDTRAVIGRRPAAVGVSS